MAQFLYSHVADTIEHEIRGLEVGTRLDSERSLSSKYKVSRNVLREALRSLSEKGVVEILPGKGVYVADNGGEKLTKNMEELLLRNDSSLRDIVEVRAALETAAWSKAVERASDDDLEALQRLYDEMERCRNDVASFNQLDMEFHIRMANCTKNAVYPILVNTFYELTDRKLFMITSLYPQRIDSAQREHKALIESIRTRDKARAKEVAGKHFQIGDILSGAIRTK